MISSKYKSTNKEWNFKKTGLDTTIKMWYSINNMWEKQLTKEL
jgi:hypothetical protein